MIQIMPKYKNMTKTILNVFTHTKKKKKKKKNHAPVSFDQKSNKISINLQTQSRFLHMFQFFNYLLIAVPRHRSNTL